MQFDHRPVFPRDVCMKIPALSASDLRRVSCGKSEHLKHCYQYRYVKCKDEGVPNRKDARGGPGTLSSRNRAMRDLLHRKTSAQSSAAYRIMLGGLRRCNASE